MKPKTIARLVMGVVLILNLILIGFFNITGPLVLVMTFGFAIAFELLVVKNIK